MYAPKREKEGPETATVRVFRASSEHTASHFSDVRSVLSFDFFSFCEKPLAAAETSELGFDWPRSAGGLTHSHHLSHRTAGFRALGL